MKSSNYSDFIGNLLAQFSNWVDQPYYYAVAAGIIFTIFIIFFALKIRLKIINKGKPTGNSSTSDTQSMMLQFFIGSNPEILNKMVADNAKNKEKIIEEIKKFSKIKNFKKINADTMEITVEIDGEDHWYRAKTTAGSHKPQILSLSKIK